MATRTHSKIRRAAGNGNVYVDPEIIRLNVLSDAALLLSSAERFALSTGAIVSVFSLAEEKLTSAAPNGRVLFGLDQTGFDADDILASHKQTAKLAVEQGQRVDVCDEQGMLQLCSCPILLKYGDRSYSKAVITAEFAESADATLRSVASMMLDQLALQISDQISSMFILHNDLANARAMTTALKVENERLEMFLDHINGGVGILDRDLRVVWSNFETDKKFGLGDQVSGKHCYELMHGRTTPCDNCVALKTFETGQPETGYNNVKSQNGKSCYFRYHVSPILGSFGNVEQAIVFAQDVTEQHLVELELQKRTEMLEIEHQRVLDASRQRTQLFATVSHDLRTPLTSIIGFSEILLEETDGPLTTRQREMLRRVNQNAERLLGMISDILDLSRLESGKMTVNLSRIGLPLLVNQIVETFQPLVKDKELLLVTNIANNLPPMQTDEQKLMRVLTNLVSNAIKFTPRGSITISAELKGSKIVISVSDTGIGIKRTDLARIFEEFKQAEGTGARKGGTGLGLAIAKKLTHLLGGEIKVTSKPGEGSTFTVILPVLLTESQVARRIQSLTAL